MIMFFTTAIAMFSCTMMIDNEPAIDQFVLIIDLEADSIIYSGKTDSTGILNWEFSEELLGKEVHVIGKYRTSDVLTSEYQSIVLTNKSSCAFEIHTENLKTLGIHLKGKSGIPNMFTLFVNPLSVDGIPEKLNKFLMMETNTIAGGYYSEFLKGKMATIKVKQGNYSIYAYYEVLGPSLSSKTTNFRTIDVVCDGTSLKVNDTDIFEALLDSDKKVEMIMVPFEN